MPTANINRDIQLDGLDRNAKQIIQALGEIYSNRNLGLNVRTFTAAATLDTTDAIVLCANGPFTIVLPTANNWSSRDVAKSPFLMVANAGATGSITVSPASGNFITGPTAVGPGTSVIYLCDGNVTWLSYIVGNSTGVFVQKAGDSMSGALTNGGNPEIVMLDGTPIPTTNVDISLKQGTILNPKANTTYKTPALYVERHTNNSSTTATSDWGNGLMEATILSETVVYGLEQGNPTGIAAKVYTAAAKPAGTPQPLSGINCLVQSNPGAAANNRDMYCANFVCSFPSGNAPSAMVGIEVDLIPSVSASSTGPWVGGGQNYIGYFAQSANPGFVNNTAFYATEISATAGWQYGYAAYGHFKSNLTYFKNLENTAAGQGIYVETTFVGSTGRVFQAFCNAVEYFRISGDSSNPVSARINGSLVNLNTLAPLASPTFTGSVGIGASPDATATLEVYVTSNTLKVPIQIRNDQAGTGVASIGFNVASSAAVDTSVCKAGIGLIRNAAQGVGDMVFYNRSSTDTSAFASTDERMRLTSGGLLGIGRTPTTNALEVNGGIVSVSKTAGVGYMTGAGGTVTQATSKSTAVTLNANCGTITMNSAALAAATIVSFTLTNSAIAPTDTLILNHVTTGTKGAYTLNSDCGSGTATISVRNNTSGSLSEAIVIRFTVIKGVIA